MLFVVRLVTFDGLRRIRAALAVFWLTMLQTLLTAGSMPLSNYICARSVLLQSLRAFTIALRCEKMFHINALSLAFAFQCVANAIALVFLLLQLAIT